MTYVTTKSKFMIIGGRNKLSQFNDIALVANNDQLENVTKFKYLGVTINQYLTWYDPIKLLQSKILSKETRCLKTNQAFSPSLCKEDVCVYNGHSYS